MQTHEKPHWWLHNCQLVMNIKIKTHRYRGGEWVTHSEPIKEAAHICYNKLFAVLQLTSSSEEKKHKCSLQINNSTGRKIRHPISKYMTFNYALFGLLCLYNYWKTSKIKKNRTQWAESSQRNIPALFPSVSVSIAAWPAPCVNYTQTLQARLPFTQSLIIY